MVRAEPAQIVAASAEAIEKAAAAIRAGDLVVFPTETVYGLGVDARNSTAVARLFHVKGRPATNPLIVHVADAQVALTLAATWPKAAADLASAFWPGPLTLVLPSRGVVAPQVTAGGTTIAIRCPAHPVAQELLRHAGCPIAAPSANRSGALSPTRVEHLPSFSANEVAWILDGGPCPGGVESTVVAIDEAGAIRLLRPGLLSVTELEQVVAGVVPASPGITPGTPLQSPGLLRRHYAPKTALELAESQQEASFLQKLYEKAGLSVTIWQAHGTPAETARRLYEDLHRLDAMNYDRILAILPPESDEWRAIRDRLTRAAAEE